MTNRRRFVRTLTASACPAYAAKVRAESPFQSLASSLAPILRRNSMTGTWLLWAAIISGVRCQSLMQFILPWLWNRWNSGHACRVLRGNNLLNQMRPNHLTVKQEHFIKKHTNVKHLTLTREMRCCSLKMLEKNEREREYNNCYAYLASFQTGWYSSRN